MFFASGDSGVAGPGYNCLGPNATIFGPSFPNNCPYIINVGATKAHPNRSVHDPESAAVNSISHPYAVAFSSGEGFSNIHPQPDYQEDTVNNYFINHNPPYSYY
jgi:tripeptidyl-peptidase-1